jgi:predicted RNase H-like HicB family nuclease
MTIFIAIVRTDGNSGYTASFPDFAGCAVTASTVDLVIARAKEALLAHVEHLLDARQKISVPTAADKVEIGDALLLAAVEVPDDLRTLSVELALPALSLARVDAFARRRGLTRSALLVEAVDHWILQENMPGERRGGGAASDGPTLFDFANPLELRMETIAADIGLPGEAASEQGKGEKIEPTTDANDITEELARLLDRRSGPQPEAEENEPRRRLHRDE